MVAQVADERQRDAESTSDVTRASALINPRISADQPAHQR
jgi:hypothetical protein